MIFLDTYAFFEILSGNPGYARFQDESFVTTVFNLAEFHYKLKREGVRNADRLTERFFRPAEVILRDLSEGSDIRLRRKRLSLPDAVGYAVARRLGVPFVTGDSEFRGMEGVEFVR